MRKWPVLMPLLTVGFYVALSLLIPTILGWWIGKLVHHEVLLPLIGLGIGSVIMVYGVYRMLLRFLQEADWREEDSEQVHQPMRAFLELLLLKQKRNKEG